MENAEPEKKRSKLTSSKLWVTIWAVLMVTFIVIADRTQFVTIAQWLCGVPLAYIGANVFQKKIFEDGAKGTSGASSTSSTQGGATGGAR